MLRRTIGFGTLTPMAHIEVSNVIPATTQAVFDFLCHPHALAETLKPIIEVEMVSVDAPLRKGSEYTFIMSRYGLAQAVRLRIEDVVKGRRLNYRQAEGLFKTWNHTCKLEDHGDGQTLVTDLVDYQLPFGLLGFLADDLLIKRDMMDLLAHRQQKAIEHFTAHPSA